MNSHLIVIAAFLLAGCSGQVKEYLDNADYAKSPDDENAKGIRVYMPTLMKVTSKTTTYTDPTSKKPSSDCKQIESVSIEARPDYSKPLRVRFDHGPFDTFTFGVTLNADGVLMAINSQNTPPVSSIAPLITAISGALTAKLAPEPPATTPLPPCTETPRVLKIERCVGSGSVVCEVPQ